MSSQKSTDSEKYTVGIDFGTLSGRALVVRVSDGREIASAEHAYRHGVVTDTLPGGAVTLPAQWALQVPSDYIDVLRTAVPEAVARAGIDPADVVGVGTDFTACTMVPVRADGTPLCELDGFADRPHAYAKLWRHHSPQPQADRINAVAAARGESWLPRYGGLISSEWEFAKGLEIFDEDPLVYAAMDRFVEGADWIVWQLTGTYLRNACSAGYKGIRQDGRYPSREFLAEVRPGFENFVTDKLDQPIGRLGQRAGGLSAQAAAWTGLPEGIAVAVGNVDAHVTVAAADALDAGKLVAIMGTSTCHVMNSDVLRHVPGMCGVVRDGISDGSWGYEAGQSGVGDIFAWFVDNCVPESYQVEARRRGISLHEHLTELAGQQRVGQHGLVALDWHSGNRSVLVDHELSGVMIGQTLATTCVDMYRALLEATAFGTRMIVETFVDSGVPVNELVVAGGLLKNRLLMQIYADVVGLPLSVVPSAQAPALGSAIHAAAAAGVYPDVPAAAARMGRRIHNAYTPIPENAAAYDRLYREYVAAYEWFGRGNEMMRRLRRIGTRETLGATA
ncbi:ribulokinase [Mycolicibacterium phlei]|uniref:Ribulokinase n=1 Tax=Mycolicibacterium phlei DSM 43239 = CCUG 21000 TaxID=1226750 RepID=A0A5N5V3R7_MYCPH|nr:ribulokinase [Mycolicibacterium phlei]VEG08501.1 ribulokinase [Mycobacteroides chelonae]AMO60381.1 Ribulokinase [Mycolicibacterium phlei]KAB7756583.1 ribulokinase [Mycolicibacterium phlei DSM 43239 = CCUG 21000]KXW62012.1 ribulokinase [Mycolicibacterium phlei DSM 43072]KXW63470.1 ribulokinase [Mycolicibacterium phlei DSM 43239 = CCUG 21000]